MGANFYCVNHYLVAFLMDRARKYVFFFALKIKRTMSLY